MSIDLNIYVLTRRPAQGPVREGLAPLGLGVTFLSSWDSLALQQPPVISSGVVAGYQTEDASHVSALLKARDKASLEALYSDERLALVTLDVDNAFSFSTEFEADLKGARVARGIRTALRNASALITLSTSARRNDLSLEFQRSLWASMGVTCGGVLEDPEESEFTDASKA